MMMIDAIDVVDDLAVHSHLWANVDDNFDDDFDDDGDDDDNDVAVLSHLRARSSNSASLLPSSQCLWMG